MRRNQLQNRTRNRAFTLIELMLVMVILAILAAVVVPKMTGQREKANKAAAKTDVSMIGGALDQYEVDQGHYPSSEEGLNALVQQPSNAANWRQYVNRLPKDPWGTDYVYQYPGQHNPNGFDLYSTQGGKDSSGAEINNWGGTATK